MMIHDTLQSEGKELPLVSVISPFYNTQDYIADAIDSVINQTYPNWELILVDDGSTDRSAEIVRDYMAREARIRLITIENHGQGYARNLALKSASGKYVMFLDSDDTIEDATLDLTVARLEADGSDFVVFDWLFYYPDRQQTGYKNKDSFFSQKSLVGEECLSLLKIMPVFIWNKVYRLDFLKRYGISFGEGYIYEDQEFWVETAVCAESISLIHSPLYRYTTNPTSSTKTKIDTNFHAESFLIAVEKCIDIFMQSRNKYVAESFERAKYDLLVYFYRKFATYYMGRTPKRFRRGFLKRFVDEMSSFGVVTDYKEWKIITFCLDHEVFSKKKYSLFEPAFLYSAKYHPLIKKRLKAGERKAKKVLAGLKELKLKPSCENDREADTSYTAQLKQELYNDVILFMGFDYVYTGNSRYLYEELKAKNICDLKLYFVTDSPLVAEENRIEPGSDRFYRFVARSKIIIFETWIPLKLKHRDGTTWIQLWHGTPLMKLLFDSNERCIMQKKPNNKNVRYSDIKRWDYLLTDTPAAMSYFKTCFLFPESRQLSYGYPRVDYLISKKNDEEFRDSVKESYGIPKGKKIVLYLPTWRDYNYNLTDADKDFDTSYIINLRELKTLLGDEYEIVYKDHAFLSKPENIDFRSYRDAETQELLLTADYLLTDYSSVMFDALAIDIPILLYCNDFERNEADRGVYESIWRDLKPFVCMDVEEVSAAIKAYNVEDAYRNVKAKYSHRSEGDLVEFILRTWHEDIHDI